MDLSNTNVIDSSGVGALVRIYKAASKNKHKLILQHPKPSVLQVLEISGLIDVFQLKIAVTPFYREKVIAHPSVNSALKRLIDIVGAIVGLAITAVIFIPITIAIKIDSPGSVLFSQTRCGWLGGKFKMWKFLFYLSFGVVFPSFLPLSFSCFIVIVYKSGFLMRLTPAH